MSSQENETTKTPSVEDMQFIEGAHALPRFQRNHWLSLGQVGDYRMAYGNEGVYLSAYLYDQYENIDDAHLFGDMYLDFDDEEDLSNSQRDAILAIWYLRQPYKLNLPESSFRIYFSGNKGFHIFIPATAFGLVPDKNLNEHFKLMAMDVRDQCPNGTLDTKIYDRRRVLRMANSKHEKTGLYKVPLTYKELCELTPDEIREKAKSPFRLAYPEVPKTARAVAAMEHYREQFKTRFQGAFSKHRQNAGKPLDFTPACVQELLDAGPTRGQRNHTACVLTSFFMKRGMTEEETWEALLEWYNIAPSRDFPERELKQAMNSIWKSKRNYGCSTLSELATCIGSDCPLFKHFKSTEKGTVT